MIRRILWLGLFILVLVSVYYLLREFGILAIVTDADRLKNWISGLGYAGPISIIALMAIAIVVNPIPSAPIALTAGAIYGHTWGTVYVVIGAASGALGAFWISRYLGYELLQRYVGKRVQLGWLGSQNALMGMVFVSRLIPFLSFDLVSYGAGLTPLKTWRFGIATLAGLVPASFLLAHFGGELTSSSLNQVMAILLIFGVLFLIPIVFRGFAKNRSISDASPRE
ncbi:TVP38/TMEM64 family protein [Sedimenticola selenatireducens]|uniref:TVP38/TMEM64 family protein n=1 Tax=Sedimenticola selenatireducens TaxID=191960 RepID=UPI00048AADCD|nr:TVP38/TMEM64 family protein [Sedimenticola selenatireducens]